MSAFRNELLEMLLAHSGQFIDIQDLINKYCGSDTTFAPEDHTLIRCRLHLNLILRELKNMEWILLSPQWGMSSAHMLNHETGRRYFIHDQRVQARLTTKGELEYKQSKYMEQVKGQSVTVTGDNKGQIVLGGDNANQSLDNALINPIIDNTTNSKPAHPAKRSWLEILMWIVGIASGIFVIWEFVLKRFFNSP